MIRMLASGMPRPMTSLVPSCISLESCSPAPFQLLCQSRHLAQLSHSSKADRAQSSTAASTSEASPSPAASAWWTNIRAALFPVSSSASKEAAKASTQSQETQHAASKQLVVSSLSMQRLKRLKDAERRHEESLAATSDVFIPLSRDAENFSGNLFKVGMIMISLPLAGWFVSKTLLMSLCIKGLQSNNPSVIKMSLSRVQSFIFNNYLAARFEQDDGVVMLVSLMGHQEVLSDPDVMRECLAAITHLLKFEETRTALLLGMVTERLQRALDRGWVAASVADEARRVQHTLEASKQEQMEAAFGRTAGSTVGQPAS